MLARGTVSEEIVDNAKCAYGQAQVSMPEFVAVSAKLTYVNEDNP